MGHRHKQAVGQTWLDVPLPWTPGRGRERARPRSQHSKPSHLRSRVSLVARWDLTAAWPRAAPLTIVFNRFTRCTHTCAHVCMHVCACAHVHAERTLWVHYFLMASSQPSPLHHLHVPSAPYGSCEQDSLLPPCTPCSPHGLSSAPFPAVSLELCVRLLMAHFYDLPQPCQVCRELASCLTSPDEERAPPLGSEPVPRAPPDTRHRPSPQ